MMESLPGLMFHIPSAIRKTDTKIVVVVKPIKAKGIWKLELYSGAKFSSFSPFTQAIFKINKIASTTCEQTNRTENVFVRQSLRLAPLVVADILREW